MSDLNRKITLNMISILLIIFGIGLIASYFVYSDNNTQNEYSSFKIVANSYIVAGKEQDIYVWLNNEKYLGNIEWTSSNPDIALVTNGKIKTLKTGKTTITAKLENGEESSIEINVVKTEKLLKGFELIGKNKIEVGSSFEFKVTYNPNDATNKLLTWTSSNNSVAKVTNGKVTGIKEGKATITAKSSNGKIAKVNIIVVGSLKELESIQLKGINEIKIGDSFDFEVIYNPSNVENKQLTWTSSNPSVAKVENGKVTGMKEGKATITAKSSNGKTASFNVNVLSNVIALESLSISGGSSVVVGESSTYFVDYNPSNVTDKTVSWSSSDNSIAEIDNNGKVTGKKAGNVIITVTSKNNKKAEKKISVVNKEIPVTSITIIGNDSVDVGKTLDLTLKVEPTNATLGIVTWKSSDDSVAKVNNGIVTGIKAGSVKITASTSNGKMVTKDIKVNQPVTSVSLSGSSSVNVGSSITLTATVSPSNATDKTIIWTSDNTSIATISNGVVKGVKAGSVKITAKSSNGKTATKTITVVQPVTSVSLSGSSSVNVGSSITLTATVSPSNATNKTVTWASSNTSIATVSNGVVKGIKAGTVEITATAGGKNTKKIITVVNPTIAVTSVSLSGSSSVNVGSSITLTATVSPSNATNKTVTWTSSNTSVATVSNGVVKGIKAGTVEITATAGGKSTKKTITVVNPTIAVTGVTLSGNSSVNVGSSITLTATVSPSNATNKTITWTSSNTSVATVSNGKVTGIKGGSVTITAKSTNGKTATKTITIVQPVTSVSLSGSSSVNVGSSITLTATVSPSNATNKTVTWTSSNTSVATVSNGKVTGIKGGSVTITAKSTNGKTATKTITIVQPVTGVSLSGSGTVNKGSSITLTATISPSDATDKTITWTSSNTSVATVSNGKVTGVKAGSVTITARSTNGKTATKTITVKDVVKVSLKVGTFNVARFRQSTYAWSSMADIVKNNGLDIVGIQEGHAAEKISKYPSNFIKGFVNRTGLTNYVYLSNLDGNHINGNTIISKHTFQSNNNYLLTKCYENRAIQKVVIKVNGVNISFYNSHFSYQKDGSVTSWCPYIHLQSALSYMKNDPNPAILTGDFNWNYTYMNKYMDSSYTLYTTKCEPGRKCAENNNTGEDKMDLIYVKEKDSNGIKRIEKVSEDVVDTSRYSDHNLVFTTVNIIN